MRRLLLSALFVACAMSTAQAASVSYTSTEVGPTTVPFSSTVQLSQFNPSLGTLTGITFTVNTSITAEVDVENLTGTPQPFTNASASVPVTATGPDGTTASTTATASVASGIAAPGFNSYPGLTDSTSGSASVLSSNWSAYIGTSSFGADFTFAAGDGNYGGSAGTGVLFGGSASAGGSITVTYFYTVIPEPSSITLAGLGLVGLVGVVGVHRRRSRAA